jgi:hypothetical protein
MLAKKLQYPASPSDTHEFMGVSANERGIGEVLESNNKDRSACCYRRFGHLRRERPATSQDP